ncbi:MAG: helix-turn-helix transcriptional regulator [Planctomycetota bacterium]
MPAVQLQPLETTALFALKNDDITIGVEQSTGFIRTMTWNKTGLDLFKQVRQNLPATIGGLRIYDEKDEKWYSDLNDPFTLSKMRQEGPAVRFSKRFAGAPFKIDVTLRLEADALHWEIYAVKNSAAVADRSLRFYFFLPLIAGWEFWAPAWQGEFTFDGMSSFEYMYVQIPYVSNKEIVLPAVSHYNPALDVGFTMLEPIDAQVPAAKFQFENGQKCFNWGSMKKDIRTVPVLEAVNYYVGLVGDRPMSTKVMVMFHGGDWRPGVGKIYNKYREFFDPSSDTIYKYEGVFSCEGVQTADEIQRCKDFQIKTLEVHGHFENYCDYFQDGRDSWITNDAKERYFHLHKKEGCTEQQVVDFYANHSDEQIAEHLGIPLKSVRHHRSDIKARLQKLADAGVGLYWYFNYTDGFRPTVEKRWPDSIAHNEDGTPQPSGWHMSHNMNADPRWSFGQFAIESARKIVDTYPMLNGFFLDCFRHFEIDFAHDDGITVVNNKPAYSMNFSYDGAEAVIKPLLIERNMATFANKPQSVRSMRWSDGVLLEGSGDVHEEKFFWACVAKPLFFMWTRDEKSIDENLRRAVYNGSFPKYAADADKSYAENKALFDRYLPLCGQFRRRVLCFEPDPLRVPKGSRAKLYTVGDDYVAGIMSEYLEADDQVVYGHLPHAVFRVARGHDVTRVGVMLPGDTEFRSAEFKFNGTFIFVPMKDYKNCAAVRLFVTKNSGKAIGAGRFQASVDYCGDPESSFSERNER